MKKLLREKKQEQDVDRMTGKEIFLSASNMLFNEERNEEVGEAQEVDIKKQM